MDYLYQVGDVVVMPYRAPWYMRFYRWALGRQQVAECEYKITAVSHALGPPVGISIIRAERQP